MGTVSGPAGCFCYSVAVFVKWALFILYTLSCIDGRIGTFYKFIGFMSLFISRAMFMTCTCPELSNNTERPHTFDERVDILS